MIDEDIVTALTGDPTISAMLGAVDAVYPDSLPQDADLPAIVYEVADGMPADGYGDATLTPWTITLKAYAPQRATSRALDAALISFFHHLNGPFGGASVTGGRVASVNRFTEEDPLLNVAVLQIELIERI